MATEHTKKFSSPAEPLPSDNPPMAELYGWQTKPWNGEFYVSFGGATRSWADARQYGFISAGGKWHSRTLNLLSPGDRIWVNIPHQGYVGVGRVRSKPIPAKAFTVRAVNVEHSCFEILKTWPSLRANADDLEKAEYFVRVDWLYTVSQEEVFKEPGLYGSQNTVCRPVTHKWRHTVDRLKQVFDGWARE